MIVMEHTRSPRVYYVWEATDRQKATKVSNPQIVHTMSAGDFSS